MKLTFVKKFIIVLTIVSLSTITLQPKPADAFFPDWLNASIQVIGHGIQAAFLGIDSAANTFQTALQSVREVLSGIPIEYGPARKALSAATTSCEILGGNFFAAQTLAQTLSSGGSSSSNGDLGPANAGDSLPNSSSSTSSTSSSNSTSAIPTGIITPGIVPNSNPQVKGVVTTTPSTATSAPSSTSASIGNPGLASTITPPSATPGPANAGESLSGLTGSLVEVGDQTKANLSLVIGQKLGLLKHRQTCYTILNQSIQSAMLIGGWNSELKQAFIDTLAELNTKSAPINSQINDLTKQQVAAKQDIFKAIASSVALQTTEANTKATVDDLKPKLTVGSYSKVSDALSKRVYAVEAIKKNYDNDKSKQLIMTSFLDAELATDKAGRDQALRSARALVEAGMVNNPDCKQAYELTDYSQDSFNNIPSLVDPSCDVGRVYDSAKSEFSKLMAESKVSADSEVGNGSGFMSTRACIDTTDKEKQVSTITAEAAKKLETAHSKRVQLERSGTASQSDLIDAINAEKNVIAEVNSIPTAVAGGIQTSCGPITDSGSFIKTQLDNYINQWLTQGIQGTKSDNLPLVAQFTKTIAGKLFGGLILKKGQQNNVFTELGSTFLNAILKGDVSFGGGSSKISTPPIVDSNSPVISPGIANAGDSLPGGSTSNNTSAIPTGIITPGIIPNSNPTIKGVSTDVPTVPYFSPRSSNILGAY